MTDILRKKLRPVLLHVVETLLDRAVDAIVTDVTERVTVALERTKHAAPTVKSSTPKCVKPPESRQTDEEDARSYEGSPPRYQAGERRRAGTDRYTSPEHRRPEDVHGLRRARSQRASSRRRGDCGRSCSAVTARRLRPERTDSLRADDRVGAASRRDRVACHLERGAMN